MKLFYGQLYTQAGSSFPFSHVFQQFMGARTTELVKPSSTYINGHGEDYSLMFRISAKRELAINEIVGPTVYKKDRDVEYSIFLPYTPITQMNDPNRSALEYLFEAVYEVLEGYEIDTSKLRAEQKNMIEEIMSRPEMFFEMDDVDDDDG